MADEKLKMTNYLNQVILYVYEINFKLVKMLNKLT